MIVGSNQLLDFVKLDPETVDRTSSVPRVSVVVPSFNQAEYLEYTLRSVLNQRYPNLELIVIDGGSTDGSTAILERYGRYLTYWVSEADRGQSHAINKGCEVATGEILTYLNSDDLLSPWRPIQNAVTKLQQAHCKMSLVYGHAYLIDSENMVTGLSPALPYSDIGYVSGRFAIPQPGTFFTREVFEATGGFNETNKVCMDGEFWLKAQANGTYFILSDHIQSAFRLHSTSITVSKRYQEEYENRQRAMRQTLAPSMRQWLSHRLVGRNWDRALRLSLRAAYNRSASVS
ncbi:MAG: glycosyltransferase family 2 protein [Myxococcota bacterium]